MTWAQARRLDYIDLLLLTRGQVRRNDLIEAFGVSMGQASIDINEFVHLYPHAATYNKTAKRYVPIDTRYRPVRKRMMDRAKRDALALLAGMD